MTTDRDAALLKAGEVILYLPAARKNASLMTTDRDAALLKAGKRVSSCS
jgi:hypothetical protein